MKKTITLCVLLSCCFTIQAQTVRKRTYIEKAESRSEKTLDETADSTKISEERSVEPVQVKTPLFSQGTGKWTLKQCVDYAIENNIDLRQQSLNVKSAEIDLSTSKNSRLPNLN